MLQIPEQKFREILLQDNLMTAKAFDVIAQEAQRLGQRTAEILISRNIITEQYYTNLLSSYFSVSLAGLEGKEIDMNILKLLPEDLARQKRVIIFSRESDGALSSAMEDPSDLVSIEFLERYLKQRIKPYLAV